MPLVRRTILVLSLVTIAAMCCSNLHAQDKTDQPVDQSVTPKSDGKAYPSLLHVGGMQSCTTSSIWCPDDYRPKCAPRICPPTYCGTCDYYEPKCAPCICLPKYCGTCDCYDAKCPPCVKIPCRFPSFYKCPPPQCCGGTTVRAAVTKQPRGYFNLKKTE